MIYFKESVYDTSKGIFSSNNMITENWSTSLYVNEERTIKKIIFSFSIFFKLFTILFFIFLYFHIEDLLDQENLPISLVKLNKSNLRILSENCPDDAKMLIYGGKRRKKYNDFYEVKVKSLIGCIYDKWELFCSSSKIRYSIPGRKYEYEKFMLLYEAITKDIKNFQDKVIEEFQVLQDESNNSKDYSHFFKSKERELKKVIDEKYKCIPKYIKECTQEWESLRKR